MGPLLSDESGLPPLENTEPLLLLISSDPLRDEPRSLPSRAAGSRRTYLQT